jgi:hypothetical protein
MSFEFATMMMNVMILGACRSGTSMTAGLFRSSGAFMGKSMLAATPENPLGYYEDPAINRLNNLILHAMLRWPWILNKIRTRICRAAHVNALWLAAPRSVPRLRLEETLIDRLKEYSNKTPFCYKDPRLSHTLPYWRPFLPHPTVFLVVFREPNKTVDSIFRADRKLNPAPNVSQGWAYTYWYRTYKRLLEQTGTDGKSMLVHYDAVVTGEAVPAIQNLVGYKLDPGELNPEASRAEARALPRSIIAKRCAALYAELCARASRDLMRLTAMPHSKDLTGQCASYL